MWIFTKFGFYSAVQKNSDCITVGSRVESDLDNLRDYMPSLSKTISHAGTDYPFRATIGKTQFATGLKAIALDVDYDNFKNSVAENMGYARAKVCADVWAELIQLEELDGLD